jgi:hypothetical protein
VPPFGGDKKGEKHVDRVFCCDGFLALSQVRPEKENGSSIQQPVEMSSLLAAKERPMAKPVGGYRMYKAVLSKPA